MPLLCKNNSLLGKVSPKTCQNSFCNSPIFFMQNFFPSNYMKSSLEEGYRDVFRTQSNI